MKLEDFLGTMDSGDELIISSSDSRGTYILDIECWEGEETQEKYFSAEYYLHDNWEQIGIFRDDDEPLYGANTADEFLAKCERTLSLNTDVKKLDWNIYKTRAELFCEIGALKARICALESRIADLERQTD